MKTTASVGGLIVLLLCGACSRQPETERVQQEVVFAEPTNAPAVPREDIPLEEDKYVEIDFNRDGLMDLAVIEQDGEVNQDLVGEETQFLPAAADGAKEPVHKTVDEQTGKGKGLLDRFTSNEQPDGKLAIYIQRGNGSYYLGGMLAEPQPGKIIGLMYKRNEARYYDLVVVHEDEKGHNKVVKYRNDGESFQRDDAILNSK
jgi:hypothetical protein